MKKDKLAALSASKSLSALAPTLSQSKYANCTEMGESESANWAWDMLWYAGQQNYVKMKVLDTIRIEHGNISSWIFTMNTDGLIKSRSKQRWNLPSVFDKCVDTSEVVQVPETLLKAHYCQFQNNKPDKQNNNNDFMNWQITKKGQLASDIFDTRNEKQAALIAFNRIEGNSYSFAEISLEINANSKAAISEKPKVVTYSFYTGHSLPKPEERWMEKKEDLSAFPPKRLVCVNKQTCLSTEIFINDLKKVLEDRSKCKIVKLSIIVVLEGVDEGEKVVWLHHVKDIILANQNTKKDGSNNVMNEYGMDDIDDDIHANDRFHRKSNAPSDLSVVQQHT